MPFGDKPRTATHHPQNRYPQNIALNKNAGARKINFYADMKLELFKIQIGAHLWVSKLNFIVE